MNGALASREMQCEYHESFESEA